MDKEAGKKRAAEQAATHVERGMTLGLGTGSTAKYFVEIMGERIKEGWALRAIPTSEETRRQAQAVGIEIITPDETTNIDLAVDGADEADPDLNLIKGGGGALLREKIVASAARKFIVIADNSKRVVTLGAFPLPVEIDPFAWALTVKRLRQVLVEQGYDGPKLDLRAAEGAPILSDGGNLIIDCALERIASPALLDKSLLEIPGVVETGLFCGIADLVIYGDADNLSTEPG